MGGRDGLRGAAGLQDSMTVLARRADVSTNRGQLREWCASKAPWASVGTGPHLPVLARGRPSDDAESRTCTSPQVQADASDDAPARDQISRRLPSSTAAEVVPVRCPRRKQLRIHVLCVPRRTGLSRPVCGFAQICRSDPTPEPQASETTTSGQTLDRSLDLNDWWAGEDLRTRLGTPGFSGARLVAQPSFDQLVHALRGLLLHPVGDTG